MFCMQEGCTLLSAACAGGLSDVAQFLINKGAPIDVTDRVSYNKANVLVLIHVQYMYVSVAT